MLQTEKARLGLGRQCWGPAYAGSWGQRSARVRGGASCGCRTKKEKLVRREMSSFQFPRLRSVWTAGGTAGGTVGNEMRCGVGPWRARAGRGSGGGADLGAGSSGATGVGAVAQGGSSGRGDREEDSACCGPTISTASSPCPRSEAGPGEGAMGRLLIRSHPALKSR